jgi:transposase
LRPPWTWDGGKTRRGHALHRSKIAIAALMDAVRQLEPKMIAMEACSSAHYWARQFKEVGIDVKLISPHYVKPFVKTNKNDRNDAEAIVEAACRPSMNFVPVKSVEQQDIQAVHRMRELLMHQRTALINQARGLLAERGITIARSPGAFKSLCPRNWRSRRAS